MTEVYMEITGAVATARKVGPLTAGMVGVPVMFSFSPEWQELNLLAVFRAGEEKKDNEIKEGRSVIPAQVLTQPGQMLCIGVEGRSKDGALVIPTVWAEVGRILDGAQAANDPALAPTPTQFERFMAGLEQVDEKLRESLRQAKESGEFNGTSVTHRWEGTTLEVTSASGTSRAELKGEPGHTPVKGVDYFTEEDKQEFQEAVCVTCDHSTGKCSHTLAQIQELAARGKIVTLKTSNNPEYTYYLQDSESGLFVSLDPGGEALNYYYASVNREGDVDQHRNHVPIDAVRFYATQILSEEFKARARDNIGAAAAAEAVKTVNGVSPDAEGNVQIEGGSGMGGADWNAAEGEPGHVLNRTHWVESEMVEILPETTISLDGKEGQLSDVLPLVVGQTYVVTWDGEEYTYVAQDYSSLVPGAVGFGSDQTGKGIIAAAPGIGTVVAVNGDEKAETTISIYQNNETIHKLPSKFLPEALQFGDKEVVILPETELTFVTNPDMGMAMAVFTPSAIPVEGAVYHVTCDGVEYECAAVVIEEGLYYFGNTAMMDGVDNGMPIGVIVTESEGTGVVISFVGETTANVSITGIHPVPMDVEYAPEPVFIDMTALGLGEVNNSAKVELIFTDADARKNIEKQFRAALKQGIIKVKFDYSIKHGGMLYVGGSVSGMGGDITLPMIIRGDGEYCTMSSLFEDNIIHMDYSGGTFSAIARRLTLATEV